jgi:ribose transport system substrate-binding protein
MFARTIHSSARRNGLLIAAVSALAIAVTGCGSSSPSTTSTTTAASPAATSTSSSASTTSSSGGTISASTIASLKATVTKAEAVPSFTAPGPAVSASVLKGKSLVVFPINSQIDACQTQSEDFEALGKQLGAKVTLVSNSGNPTQWTQAVQDGVAAHDAGVAMLCGVVPGAIGPELTAAKNAGVKVVDGNYNDTSDYTGLDGETAVQTTEGVADDVDQALVNLGGKPLHALVVTTDSIIQGPAAQTAIQAEMTKVCPSSCSIVDTVTVPIQNWATAIQSDTASALVAHSDINAVIIPFDGLTQFADPAIAKVANLKVYTWGGSRSVEKLMESPNSVIAADPGPDEDWDAYEAMDQLIRTVGGHAAASVNAEVDPNRFWVPSNVSAFFGPGGTYGNGGYGGNAFISGFDKLWGVS